MAKKKVASMAYYNKLDIQSDATPEDIKKAYRRKALQLHPDKRGNTPEAQEEFTSMKQAYDVLSDPKKREVYDQAGEDGIRLMENMGSMSPEEMVASLLRSLGAFEAKGKCMIISVVTLFFSFFLIIPVFWCLRVDETVTWSWVVVFIPLWILDAIVYTCLCCSYMATKPDPEEKKDEPPVLLKLYMFLKILLFLPLQIFIAMKLNGDFNWSTLEVLIPYFIYDVLTIIETIIGGCMKYHVLTKESEGAGMSTTEAIREQRTMVIHAMITQTIGAMLRLAQGVLFALKVDDTGSIGEWSWWLVFIPIWIHIAYICYIPIRRFIQTKKYMKNKKNPKQKQEQAHDAYTRESVADDEEELNSKSPLLDFLGSLICIGVVVSPYFILTARLDGGSFSSFYVLLPWFTIVGIILCCICCAIACLGAGGMEDEVNMEEMEQDGGADANDNNIHYHEMEELA